MLQCLLFKDTNIFLETPYISVFFTAQLLKRTVYLYYLHFFPFCLPNNTLLLHQKQSRLPITSMLPNQMVTILSSPYSISLQHSPGFPSTFCVLSPLQTLPSYPSQVQGQKPPFLICYILIQMISSIPIALHITYMLMMPQFLSLAQKLSFRLITICQTIPPIFLISTHT